MTHNTIIADERTSLLHSSKDEGVKCDSHQNAVNLEANASYSGANDVDQNPDDVVEVTYWSLIRNNPKYSLYMASYVTNYFGSWLTYLSSLAAIQVLLENDNLGRHQSTPTIISYLVVVRLMTCVLLSPLGGALADGWDRRWVMIVLDLLGACVSWMFVLAVSVFQSIPMILLATILQQVVEGLYDASRCSLLPLLVGNDEEKMKKATIISGMAWSAVAAFGSALGGVLVSLLGTEACFVLDSMTYLASAAFIFAVGPGPWNVSEQTVQGKDQLDSQPYTSVGSKTMTMMLDGVRYMYSSPWGPLVFIKISVMLMVVDVVSVSFASKNTGGNESLASLRLGLLFGGMGIGCFVGPVVAERFVFMDRPETLQQSCIISIGISAMMCFLMGIPQVPFAALCVLTGIRAAGVSIAWINSCLLIQKFSSPQMLGRVFSIDSALGIIGESVSALASGQLEDRYGWTPEKVCRGLGILGSVLFFGWTLFHINGGGAAKMSGKSQTTLP